MTDDRTLHEHAYPLARRLVAMAARQHRAGEALHFELYYAEVARALEAFALAAGAARPPAPAELWAAGE